MAKKQIEEVLSSKMNRRDFLRYSGLAMLSVLGINNLIKTLGSFGKTGKPKLIDRGYGASKYGK